MIPVKIECGCGQHYAFDVEPVEGRMPYAVHCPSCGVDGTAAAERIISQTQTGSAAPAKPKPVVRVVARPKPEGTAPTVATAAAPVAVRVVAGPQPGTGRPTGLPAPDLDRAIAEARSKVCWGDSFEEVVKFAMMQGIQRDDAIALVTELMKERLKMLREAGIRKILIGGSMVCLPIATYIGFSFAGVLPLKLFGLTVAVGLYGAYKVTQGIFMLVMPESESGDVADK